MNQLPTLLVDGHNLAWTSLYSAAKSDPNFDQYTPETAREVVYGILNTLAPLVHPARNLLGRHNIVVALDEGRNWRQAIDPTYKGGRGGANNPTFRFGAQIARLPGELAQFGIRTVSVPTLEGDDVIGLLSERPDLAGTKKVLLSRDKDILSFVSDDVYVFNPSSKTLVTARNFGAYTQGLFKVQQPLSPAILPVFRALVGDPSDGLTGVPQCGPTFALTFIRHVESRGAVFTGYRQTPEDLLSQVRDRVLDLPAAVRHLGTPQSLETLAHTFRLVQVAQAPAHRRSEVSQLDISPLERPDYPQVKDALLRLGFPYFVNKGPEWAAGFLPPAPEIARPRPLQEALSL